MHTVHLRQTQYKRLLMNFDKIQLRNKPYLVKVILLKIAF